MGYGAALHRYGTVHRPGPGVRDDRYPLGGGEPSCSAGADASGTFSPTTAIITGQPCGSSRVESAGQRGRGPRRATFRREPPAGPSTQSLFSFTGPVRRTSPAKPSLPGQADQGKHMRRSWDNWRHRRQCSPSTWQDAQAGEQPGTSGARPPAHPAGDGPVDRNRVDEHVYDDNGPCSTRAYISPHT